MRGNGVFTSFPGIENGFGIRFFIAAAAAAVEVEAAVEIIGKCWCMK